MPRLPSALLPLALCALACLAPVAETFSLPTFPFAAALPTAAPSRARGGIPLRAAAAEAAEAAGEGRRAALKALALGALGGALGGGGAGGASAAVPTMSEYNVGSGTVIRPDAPKVDKTPEIPKPTDLASLKFALKEADATLAEMRVLVDKAAWDDIRGMLQKIAVSQKFVKPDRPAVLFEAYGGFGSDRAFGAACGADAGQAKKFEKARNNAALALKELADFAFTNRVLFFNDEDKANVARLESNLEVDLDEARGHVDSARDNLKDMAKVLP